MLAGITMTFIETDARLSSLWDTTYGRLVLVKSLITVAVLVAAAYNRFSLIPALSVPLPEAVGPDGEPIPIGPQNDDDSDDDGPDPVEILDDEQLLVRRYEWSQLRRTVGWEAVALVVVLAFTAVLVNVTPARNIAGPTSVVNLTQEADTGSVNLVVAPGRAGDNTIHIQYSDDAGRPIDVANSISVEFSLPSADLGPITREVLKAGPGHYVIEGTELSIAGEWTITLSARTGDFTEQRTDFQVSIPR